MSTLLAKAIAFAVAAHEGQEDPPGEPYIAHPLRVLHAVSGMDDAHQNEQLRCVAVLHDTIERAGATPKRLRQAGMPEAVLHAVQLLTHEKDTAYADYIVRVKPDFLARTVKIADLVDNADLRRVTFRAGKLKKDVPRLVRYVASFQFLTDQMDEKSYRQVMKKTQ